MYTVLGNRECCDKT